MKAHLVAQVRACIDEGVFSAQLQPEVALRLLTTGIIGVAVMRLSDRLGPTENADDLAQDVLDITIAGLKSGIALRSHSVMCPDDEPTLAPSEQESHPTGVVS
jgi:hypothetical protein